MDEPAPAGQAPPCLPALAAAMAEAEFNLLAIQRVVALCDERLAALLRADVRAARACMELAEPVSYIFTRWQLDTQLIPRALGGADPAPDRKAPGRVPGAHPAHRSADQESE